jgi:hypothetical protein
MQAEADGKKPTLLLHSCCAPCSSYVLEYLAPHFAITDFYYNPNISPQSEYEERREELRRLIGEMGLSDSVSFVEGEYHPEQFYAMAKGMEDFPEGGERCFLCYEMCDETQDADIKTFLKRSVSETTGSVAFLVGPEGGISPEEAAYAKENGISFVSLGKRILRTETAPLCVLSCIMYESDNMK